MPDLDGASSLWLFFLAGLSIGGLSCMAVQGGLLAAAVAQRAARWQGERPPARALAAPAVQFLTAKTVAYTTLGAGLGWVGQVFSPRFQGWVLVGVGVLMALLVLQMFDVHPWLRRLSPSPPRAVRRFIGHWSREGGAAGPAILGALTVLIPCSVTLAVELLAARTQSPLRGAQIMAAFTLGTAPLFLGLAVGGAWLGGARYRVFKPVAAIVVLAIAALSVRSGARLLGWRGDLAGSARPGAAALSAASASSSTAPAERAEHQEARIDVTASAYQPSRLTIKAGVPTTLKLVSSGARGCIRAFTVPAYNVVAMLPETGETAVELPAAPPGQIAFSCSMGMYYGVIEVLP